MLPDASNPPPFVIGHRGAAKLAPENTIPGFRRAHAEGASWVEFDVMLSADGVAMVIHDDTVDRTSNGTGAVAELSAAELASLDFGAWFGPEFAGTRIPTFAAAMAELASLGLGANVEIKPYPGFEAETARVVCRAIAEGWPAGLPGPVISSFSRLAMRVAGDALPSAARAMLFHGLPEDWSVAVAMFNCSAVHLDDASTTKPVVDAMAANGLPLRVYTINDPARARTLKSWGVQSIFTDRPDLMQGL